MSVAPGFSRVLAWAPRLLFTGAAQVAVQALGFVAGLVVIRLLSPDQYAYYTLALATLGMLTVLSDGGVSSALMAFGGPCWRDPKALGEAYEEASRYRRILSVLALCVSLPFLIYFLHEHEMGGFAAAGICIVILPLFLSTITGQMREVVLKLHQQLAFVQTVQVSSAALRVLAVSIGLFLVPAAWVAVLMAALVQILTNIPLGRRVAPLLSRPGAVASTVSAAYRNYVKRSLPGAIYFALSGQVNVFIISVLGGTQEIAQVGVAGRLGAACSIITAVTGMIIMPRFARAALQPRQQILVLYGLVAAIFLMGAAASGLLLVFPGIVPLLVGSKYPELDKVVMWAIWATIIGIASGAVFQLAAVRGHIMRPSITIVTAILSLVGSIIVVGASTPAKIFEMNALSSFGVLLVGIIYSSLKMSAPHKSEIH